MVQFPFSRPICAALLIFGELSVSLAGCVKLPQESNFATRRIATAPGPEDFVLDGNSLIIACDDRRCEQDCPDGWILRYDLASGRMDTLTRENEPSEMPFHPHGIDLASVNGEARLFIVNHDRKDHKDLISIYKVAGNRLLFLENLTSEHFRSPNAVAADEIGTVFVSNDAWNHGALGEILLSKEKSTLVRKEKDKDAEVVGKPAAFGNGVTMNKSALYQAATRGNVVYRYPMVDGGLGEREVVIKVTGPDNLRWDGNDLLVACHLRGLAFMKHAKNPEKLSPTAVYRLKTDGSKAELLFFDAGDAIPAGSTAIRVGTKLYISQVFESWILEVDLGNGNGND